MIGYGAIALNKNRASYQFLETVGISQENHSLVGCGILSHPYRRLKDKVFSIIFGYLACDRCPIE